MPLCERGHYSVCKKLYAKGQSREGVGSEEDAAFHRFLIIMGPNKNHASADRPPACYGSTHCGNVALTGIIQTQLAPGVQYSSQRLGC